MRIIQLWLTLFSIFLLPFTGSAQEKDTCLSGHLPGYPLPKGVSAPFAGFIGDWLVVAGGCNFPDIPASEGGKKVYYPGICTGHTCSFSPMASPPRPSIPRCLWRIRRNSSRSGLHRWHECRLLPDTSIQTYLE